MFWGKCLLMQVPFDVPAGKAALGMMALACAVLSGCQGGSGTAALEGAAERPRVSQTELRAFCPPVVLREGTTFFRTYERGAEGDNARLVSQTTFSDATRACSTADGQMTVKVALAGRVVPGPASSGGAVNLPIRIAVTSGDEVLYSQLHQYSVQLSSTTQATQFLFTDPNVVFPAPTGRGVRIFAGFDEGPPKTASAD